MKKLMKIHFKRQMFKKRGKDPLTAKVVLFNLFRLVGDFLHYRRSSSQSSLINISPRLLELSTNRFEKIQNKASHYKTAEILPH